MLDYKDIITKHYALGMSGRKIAESLKVSKSGVNDFLRAFQECPVLSYPLPEGITNYGIAAWSTEREQSSTAGISATRCRTTKPWVRKCLPGRT